LPWVLGITLKVIVDLEMQDETVINYDLALASLTEDQKEEVMKIAVDYVEENYGTDYSIQGDAGVDSWETGGPEGDMFHAYPSASFRVPADTSQPGMFATVYVDLETGEITEVLSTTSKGMPPPPP
jgi:hypothetical protein